MTNPADTIAKTMAMMMVYRSTVDMSGIDGNSHPLFGGDVVTGDPDAVCANAGGSVGTCPGAAVVTGVIMDTGAAVVTGVIMDKGAAVVTGVIMDIGAAVVTGANVGAAVVI
jgi:hypothetical protein